MNQELTNKISTKIPSGKRPARRRQAPSSAPAKASTETNSASPHLADSPLPEPNGGVLGAPVYQKEIAFGGFHSTIKDLFEHVLITGGTGVGKTRCALLPLIEQTLTKLGHDAEEKPGMLIIDGKGDMAEMATDCITRAGRADDLFIFGEGGNCWIPIFEPFQGDVNAIAEWLFLLLEQGSNGGGQNERYWEENAKRTLRAGVTIAKGRHGLNLGGLDGVREGIHAVCSSVGAPSEEDDICSVSNSTISALENEMLEALIDHHITYEEKQDLFYYLREDLGKLPPRTCNTIINMARNYITHFSNVEMRSLFAASGDRRRLTIEEIIDEGLILVVSLSPTIYGEIATPFRTAVKKVFCDRVMQRNLLECADGDTKRPINQLRPLIYVCDEFHITLNKADTTNLDVHFMDRCREFRCMCFLATQGISAVDSILRSESMRNHLLNNCRTKIFFATACPATRQYFESVVGNNERKLWHVHYRPTLPIPVFRLPNYEFAQRTPVALQMASRDHDRRPAMESSELVKLPNGEAIILGKAGKISRFSHAPVLYGNR